MGKLLSYSLFGLFLALVFCESLLPIRSDDFFMYLTLGRKFMREGSFGDVDPYLFTIVDFHWHVWHEWLAYLFYFNLYDLTGFTGVILFRAVFVAGLFVGVWRWGVRRGAPLVPMVLALTLAFFVALERSRVDRASLFSDVFTAALLALLLDGKFTRARHLAVGLLFAIWVNLHPGFLLGWFLIGLYALFHRGRGLSLLAVAALGTLLNPIGWRGSLYPLHFVLSPEFKIFREINAEWMPTWNHYLLSSGYKTFLAVYAVLGFAVLTYGFFRGRRFEWVAGLVFALMAVGSARFLSVSGFAFAVLTVNEIRFWSWPLWWRAPVALAGAVVTLGVTFVVSGAGQWVPPLARGENVLAAVPMAAAEFLKSQPPGNVFNEYVTGGLLAWVLDGRMKIAGHGHIDRPELVVKNYLRFSNTREDWNDIVVRGGVEYFFVFQSSFQTSPGAGWVNELTSRWQKIYSDSVAVIFKRMPP